MIVLIGGEKGGTGKSTLATNLAVYLAHQGRDVLVLDADRQSTAALWASERAQHPELPKVHCVQRYGNLFEPARDLATRYQDVIIDAGGRDSEELRSAMVAAQKVYSPIRASQSDLWTVEHVDQCIRLARSFNPKLVARVVVSMAPTNPRINEAQEAATYLDEFEQLELVECVIRDRKVFRDALMEGKGVVEMNDPKAKQELEAFAQEVFRDEIQTSAAAH